MHYRRILCLLIGLWLGGGLVMAWFGANSFSTVHNVMNQSNPMFALQTKPLGPANTRMVLRFQVAEQNRYMFQNWEYMQLILGAFFFSYMLFGTLEGKFTLSLALTMVVITAIQRFGLSNEMGNIGKSLGYVPADILVAERAKFWLMHSAYLTCEALKFGLGAVLLVLTLRRGRSVDPVNKFNMVDKANHRHVNW
jgi:hypothetical protein